MKTNWPDVVRLAVVVGAGIALCAFGQVVAGAAIIGSAVGHAVPSAPFAKKDG